MPGNLRYVNGDSPAVHIERHRAELRGLSDESLLDEVSRIPPLRDSTDPYWDDDAAWTDAYRLIAAADVVGECGWREVAGPIYERAALGDLYGMMQSIRHGPEQAFAEDLDSFADVLEPLIEHSRPGTRQWSVRELGILRLLRSLPAVLSATADPVAEVREEALASLGMLAQRHHAAAVAIERLG